MRTVSGFDIKLRSDVRATMHSPLTPDVLSRFLQVLFTDAGVMHSFLGEIDPGFIVCHDFDRIGDQNQASKIAQELAPNATVAEHLAQSFVKSVEVRAHLDGEEPLPFASEHVVIERLQRKLDALESMYCSE